MKTLITGGNGLLGSHVVDAAVERGYCIRVLVLPCDPAERLQRLGVEVCRGDLCDPKSLSVAVKDVDRVIHCAARKGPWGPKEEYARANIHGLQNLLRASLKAGVSRFVHTSSITVLGAAIRGTGDETLPLRREANPYNWSKIEGELLLQEAIRRDGAPVSIVRPGLIYGPRDTASFGRFATLVQQGKMVLIGNGDNRLPLVYARDAADAMLLASEKSQAIGQVYNVVNDEPVTQRDYLSTIAAELGAKPPTWRIPYRLGLTIAAVGEGVGRVLRSRRPPPMTRFGAHLLGGENRFNIKKARTELGFCPKVNLKEGVRLSVAWFRESRLNGTGAI
jgi:2-alkyl-3-oxoalkanoate reductase